MKQAMILAAGLGTRLKPLTDTMPKALVPVNGRPLLDINIERLRQAGYDRFVINVHHFAQQIIDHVRCLPLTPADCFENPIEPEATPGCGKWAGVEILISDESAQLLETGGGLKKAAPLFDDREPILIHNVDILDNVDYEWFSRQHLPDEDAVLLVSRRKTKRYLLFDHAMRLMGWKNIQTGEIRSPYEYVRRTGLSQHGEPLNMFAFSGIHSFSPRLFTLMERFPERFPIMDFYLSVCHRSRIVGLVKDDLRVLDVGKLDSLEQANSFQF